MNKVIKHITLCLLTVVGHCQLNGQEVAVNLKPEQIFIGQPATINVELYLPTGGVILYPGLEDLENEGLEILNYGSPDTLELEGQSIIIRQKHTITAWKEAYVPIPPLSFAHIMDGDTTRFESRATMVHVKSVEVNMEEMYKDINPIFSFPYTFREILPYLIALVFIFILSYFLIKYFRRPRKQPEQPTVWEKPEVPAHIAAISSLETLRRKELWQKGEIKQYHSELTTILRKYMDKRFGIDAIEMTSSEIMAILPGHLNESVEEEMIREVFSIADMVKFAKHKPGSSVHDWALEKSLDFVKRTRPIQKKADE